MRSGHSYLVIGGSLILMLAAAPSFGDTVYMKNGSTLKGDVKTMEGDQLKLNTSFAGTMKLDREKIAGVTTDKAVPVELHGGKSESVRFDYDVQNEKQRAKASPEYGAGQTESVKLSDVESIRPETIASKKKEERREKYTLSGYKTKLEVKQPEWSGEGRFGINGSSGNSHTLNIAASLSALRDTGQTRLNLLASVDKSSESGNETEADYLGRGRYEYDLTPRWFAFAQQSFEHDRFQDYGLRSQTTFGPGYFVLRQRRVIFKLTSGLGYQYTRYYKSADNDSQFVASFGWHYAQLFGDYLKVTHDFSAYPELSNSPTDNFSLESVLAANIPIAGSSLWFLSAQLKNDYNNNPRESETHQLDTTYSLAIQRTF